MSLLLALAFPELSVLALGTCWYILRLVRNERRYL
jgi:hypothetical protein